MIDKIDIGFGTTSLNFPDEVVTNNWCCPVGHGSGW